MLSLSKFTIEKVAINSCSKPQAITVTVIQVIVMPEVYVKALVATVVKVKADSTLIAK